MGVTRISTLVAIAAAMSPAAIAHHGGEHPPSAFSVNALAIGLGGAALIAAVVVFQIMRTARRRRT